MNIATNLNVLPFTMNMNWRRVSLGQETGMSQKNLQKKSNSLKNGNKSIVKARGIVLKLEQNLLLKLKLCRSNGKLYEATIDYCFACPTLAEHKRNQRWTEPGQNKLGFILEEYRDNEIWKVMSKL